MAGTVPYSGYGGLIWQPRDSLANPSVGDLGKMRFDAAHYQRAYNQCRGRGISPSVCVTALPGDAHVTPQNPLPQQFTKEVVDAIECMSDTGDVVQCQHYLEGLHRKVNYEAPKASAGMIEKSRSNEDPSVISDRASNVSARLDLPPAAEGCGPDFRDENHSGKCVPTSAPSMAVEEKGFSSLFDDAPDAEPKKSSPTSSSSVRRSRTNANKADLDSLMQRGVSSSLTLKNAIVTGSAAAASASSSSSSTNRVYPVTPLKETFGAEVQVRDVDLRNVDFSRKHTSKLPEQTQALLNQIRHDLKQYRLLLFRDHHRLSGLQQVEFSQHLGVKVESTFYKHPKSPHPDIFRVSNDEREGCTNVGRSGWHIDGTFI
eukprot:g4393.t1